MASTLVILISAQYSDPVTPTRQYYRPLIGGIQIETPYGFCTLGYTARDSRGRVGVITAGHCVGYSYSADVYQPNTGSASYYIRRPDIISMFADAAFIPFSNSAPYVLDINEFYGTYYASKWNVYDYVPYDDACTYFKNVPVFKTGRTTGTTKGSIYGCYDYIHPVGYVLIVTMYAAPGDSGAPVYTISPHGDGALLFGHLKGYTSYGLSAISVTAVINGMGVIPVTYP